MAKKLTEQTDSRKELDAVINPAHYKDLGQYAANLVIYKWGLGYNLGNTLKYIQRAGRKPNTPTIVDLKKAAWYLAKEIHLLDPENEPDPAA